VDQVIFDFVSTFWLCECIVLYILKIPRYKKIFEMHKTPPNIIFRWM
jgi:hypothetical protein